MVKVAFMMILRVFVCKNAKPSPAITSMRTYLHFTMWNEVNTHARTNLGFFRIHWHCVAIHMIET